MEIIHATTIALLENTILLSGPPGSGKYDMAHRLMDLDAIPDGFRCYYSSGRDNGAP